MEILRESRLSIKRDIILDAATMAFRDEGYECTSMDRIAELAGASKRTVYNHFGSKEALFQAVVERLFELYFCDGEDIGETSVLLDAAREGQMDVDLVEEVLATDRDIDEARCESVTRRAS